MIHESSESTGHRCHSGTRGIDMVHLQIIIVLARNIGDLEIIDEARMTSIGYSDLKESRRK